MASDELRLLAVTHECTRTGAPMVLLRFLEWLTRERGARVETLALRGGPLLDDFAAVGPVHLVEAYGTDSLVRRVEQGMRRVHLDRVSDRLRHERLRRGTRHLRGFDVLYVNSATSALALRILPELPPHVVSHVHELDSAFNFWMDPADRAAMLEHSAAFVVAADCVGRNLVERHGVDPARVHRCYEFIDPPTVDEAAVAAARARLGLRGDELVVGAVGTAEWRKGADLFLQVAARVRRLAPELPVRFLWVGRSLPHDAAHQRVDVAGLGLGDVVTFVGEVPDPGTYLSLFDLFCLTSREDPYPLVCLEAATLEVPVVTFANGGMVELAAADGPEPLLTCVPYLDVEAMADAVIEQLTRPEQRARQGARLGARVRAHHLSSVGARQIGAVLDELRTEWAAEAAERAEQAARRASEGCEAAGPGAARSPVADAAISG